MKKVRAFLAKFLIVVIAALSSAFTTPHGTTIKAVIFDCDGVLVDTEYFKFLAWQEALSSQQINFTIDEYRLLVGYDSKTILQKIRQQKCVDIPEEVIAMKNAKYRILQKQQVVPLHEVVRFARTLVEEKERLGLQLGVASSAPREEILLNLQQIGLQSAVDIVISGSDDLQGYVDDGGTNKPKPYIYIEAAKRLHIDPANCLVFEDTTAGIDSAVGAGMIAIALPNQFTIQQDFSKATKVIRSYTDLPKALE